MESISVMIGFTKLELEQLIEVCSKNNLDSLSITFQTILEQEFISENTR
ncbi:hypothetical protein [Spiroplasma sp. DGKH1]